MTRLAVAHLNMVYPSSTGSLPSVALDDVTFAIDDGEILALLGPSGCGKTTTLRLIAGLLAPTGGDIIINGKSVLKTPPEKREAVLVAQQHALFPFRTVAENVGYGLAIRKISKPERADRVAEALDAVHLSGLEDRWPNELSGGQQQRVALARALVVRPQLLLLDEPLSSLDQDLRLELQATISELLAQTKITTVLVTHDQREAGALADRVAVMIGGRIRQLDTPEELREHPIDAEVARYFAGPS